MLTHVLLEGVGHKNGLAKLVDDLRFNISCRWGQISITKILSQVLGDTSRFRKFAGHLIINLIHHIIILITSAKFQKR